MTFIAFSILDTKTGLFQPPFFMVHAGQAMRAFEDLANDRNTNIGRHPADFVLCQVGGFDDNIGQMQPAVPQQLATALNVQRAPQQPLPFVAVHEVGEEHVGPNGRS